jgi:hypothetical protein
MAYTKSPSQDTYSTVNFPFVREMSNRGTDTSKDEDYINIYFDIVVNKLTGEQSIYVAKRSGSTEFIAAVGSGEIRGLYYWEDQARLYVCILGTMYIYNANTGSLITSTTAFVSTTGTVGFSEFLYDTGTVKLVVSDGAAIITIDSSHVVVTSSDPDIPAHDPNIYYIDGYLLVLKTGTADFYNSDLNDPLAWTAGNFLTAEILPDQAVRLGRINNYLLMFGRKSIEYFYDAAIESGSPFQRNDTYVKYIGYLGGYSALSNRIYFVGSNTDSQPDVFMLENSSVKPVGSGSIRQHLASLTDFTELQGNIISIDGVDFYVLNTGESTYSLNIESGLWARWTYQDTDTFPIVHVSNTETTGNYRSLFVLSGDRAIYRFNPTLYQDNGTGFPASLTTDIEDFGTYNQKVMNRLTLITDKPSATTEVDVEFTDDDYQNWSTAQAVELYQELPCLYRLGRFRRRALRIGGTFNGPFRLKRIEVDINKGQT